MRRISAAIQFLGRPFPEKRPWTITKSPSATITPGSYFQRRRTALDQIEEASAAGLDMSAVLDVVGRPIALSRHIVSLVEEGIEGFEDKGFVLRLLGPSHILLEIPGCGSCGPKIPPPHRSVVQVRQCPGTPCRRLERLSSVPRPPGAQHRTSGVLHAVDTRSEGLPR